VPGLLPELRTPTSAEAGALPEPALPVLLPELSAPTLVLPTVLSLLFPVELLELRAETFVEPTPPVLPLLPVFEVESLSTLTLFEATPPLLASPVCAPLDETRWKNEWLGVAGAPFLRE
jgi:hypothetical protein